MLLQKLYTFIAKYYSQGYAYDEEIHLHIAFKIVIIIIIHPSKSVVCNIAYVFLFCSTATWPYHSPPHNENYCIQLAKCNESIFRWDIKVYHNHLYIATSLTSTIPSSTFLTDPIVTKVAVTLEGNVYEL